VLPPGPEKLHEEALGRFIVIFQRVNRGEASLSALTKAELLEMGDVMRLWQQAAHQGHSGAQFGLGLIFYHSLGVKQNYSEANEWNRKAADQGHAGAQCNLGLAYYQGEGVEKDFSEANKWYRKAADQGVAGAQFNMGLAYDIGRGLKQDFSEAYKWYRKAAEKGFAGAQCNLGVAYAHGLGVKRDYSEAMKWCLKAADQGYPNAQAMLAQFYEHGIGGVSVNPSKAIELYTLSANQGFEQAIEELDRLRALSSFAELIGSRVELAGLQAKPEMNGVAGVVKSFNAATERYVVQLDNGGQPFMLKAANLERLSMPRE
jgi:hypothetical protein